MKKKAKKGDKNVFDNVEHTKHDDGDGDGDQRE